MKILFIGGNGNISWYCTQKAIEHKHDVWILNRSQTLNTRRSIQPEVKKMTEDIHYVEKTKNSMSNLYFDVVVDFICFGEQDARDAVEIFSGHTNHFVFISSESVYKRSGHNLPFSEDCEQNDAELISEYIGGKIKAEKYFLSQMRDRNFPLTIVRPAYTYDTIIPVSIGHNCFTAPQKYLEGKPALIAGDGTNLWTFTHSRDFAEALIGLVENKDTIGEAFHIATDEWLTWNEEMEILFSALGIKRFSSIHIPYEDALKLTYFQPRDLMAQRMWHNIYDTSKVKLYLPGWNAKVSFEEGIVETIKWINEKDIRRRINTNHSMELDRLYKMYGGF